MFLRKFALTISQPCLQSNIETSSQRTLSQLFQKKRVSIKQNRDKDLPMLVGMHAEWRLELSGKTFHIVGMKGGH